VNKYEKMIGTPVHIKSHYEGERIGFTKYKPPYNQDNYGYVHEALGDKFISIMDRGNIIHIPIFNILEIRLATEIEELLM
tara:strand:+ start:870 stop:1109 length:240 start_codon:yes stop_codon:yes gene_type:complete